MPWSVDHTLGTKLPEPPLGTAKPCTLRPPSDPWLLPMGPILPVAKSPRGASPPGWGALLRSSMLAVAAGWALGLLVITLFPPAHRNAQSLAKHYADVAKAAGVAVLGKHAVGSTGVDAIHTVDEGPAGGGLSGGEGRGQWELRLPMARPRPPEWDADPMDYPKPRTFFDIAINGEPAGRIEFELYTKQAPRAAENFRVLCTGQNGSVPDEAGREGAGRRLHFKGREFYRVIDRFICQTGVETESVFGGMFKDDPGGLALKHNKKGLLSMANMGPDTNTAHFSIVVAPAPHLDGHYTIFGEVVAGMEVVDKINALAKPPGSKDERPKLPVVIVDSGQLDCTPTGECKVMEF